MEKSTTSCRVTQFGFCTICALVCLRVAVGWHFYTEGIKKFDPGFTSAGLMQAAKGPWAEDIQSFLPDPGDFRERLATARPSGITPDQKAEQDAWAAEYRERIKAAGKAKETPLAEFPPHSAYTEWAEAIDEAWQAKRDEAAQLASGGEDAVAAAEQTYRNALQGLAEYLIAEEDAIEEYRHELWRLEQLKASPGASGIEFQQERIAEKAGETTRTGRKWLNAANELEADYVASLAGIELIKVDPADSIAQLRTPSGLDWINPTVKWVVTGIGVCMLAGLATRFAAFMGAGFLLSVMASQPPWVPGADTTYFGYQIVELMVMLTIFVTGPGRWYGFDGLFNCCSFLGGSKD